MKHLLRPGLSCALLAFTAALASAQVIISDSFDSIATTNSLWSKNLEEIPANGEIPFLEQSESSGALDFGFRATIFSQVDLPADHQGSISFNLAGSELLSVGLRGSSVRAAGGYGAFYGLVLEFHQYSGVLRVMDYDAGGGNSVLGSYDFSFSPVTDYSFTWALTGSDLSVTHVGGDTFDFSGMTSGAGSRIFINNSQDGYLSARLYDVSVSAIPEPSTYAALAGLIAGVLALYVRRRRPPAVV